MLKHFILTSVVCMSLAACGGSENTSEDDTTTLLGKFIDSPVAGLGYITGDQSGVTGTDGAFPYKSGQSVKFSIGDIVIGTAKADAIMTPVDLVGSANDETDPTVTNIAAFLQTLDKDGNLDNGITITAETQAIAKGKSIDFKQTTDNFAADGNVQTVVSQLTGVNGTSRSLVSSSDAKSHLRTTLSSLIGGFTKTYSGTIHTYCPTFNYNDPITITISQSRLVDLHSNQGGLADGVIKYSGSIVNASITVQSQSRGTVVIPYTGKVDGNSLSLTGVSGDITSDIRATSN